ncbi:linoleate diol synthase [Macrolepiota fuliginosa MF-IS2]|uniref:Linoleate diol synthase n=1 Tax=Macrolepiota fuliginosa MF-IS2 TaxID=1400762 RepID=A0A9P6C6T0_9AGAR|nr:linoleate diol synthase [Macrolepiota fuliginosa MF-IS2]
MSNRLSSIFRRQPSTSTTGANGTADNVEAGFVPPPTPKAINTLRDQLKRGVITEPTALSSIMDLIRHSDAIDDRKLFLEHALTFVSKMEEGRLATIAKNKIVELLYNDLSHPAATSLGPKYAWRTADGSCNNPDLPDMGKAGTPYSRSVQQTHPLPNDQLPDAGLVFDTLLRREEFVKHPAGLSSLMFSFAALVIHSVFRTSHYDVNINETSSYVDLAPLYGHNQAVQEKVRAYNGLGYLHPDTFGEDRLLFLPPAYVAKRLFEINERGNYADPATLTPDKRAAQDEELFQTARLVNCGWFGTVVFSDYFSSILGLVRYGSSWSLTPFDEIRNEDHSFFERGKGNVCSVEFNCLYRWHSTTSQKDEKWTTNVFSTIFGPECDPDNLTPNDYKMAARKMMSTQQDHTAWTFGGLKRQADGTFRDEDLANVLQSATAEPAAAFGARGIPAIMRMNEIMGLEQSRRWGVCSLNDFRRFLGLKIAHAAEKLYGDIEYLELYVGLQAEEAKPLVEGAGLCPGYTVSRAILSDAIALTRGDRFFTHDFTPYNLTSWGFADCQRDPNAFGFGSTMGKLFLRTLPNNYSENSVYTFFPFMTPDSMKTNLTKLNVLDHYDVNKPVPQQQAVTFTDYNAVVQILKSDEDFELPYREHTSRIIKGTGFYPIEDEKTQKAVITALSGSPDLVNSIGRYFYETTQKLILENSFTLVGGNTFGVDLVKHVIRAVPVIWAATDLAGIQLKTKENPGGVYTPQELFDILSDIYSFIFVDIEASKVRVLQYKVEENIQELLRLIKMYLGVGNRLTVAGIVGTVSSLFSRSKRSAEHHEIVKRLYELGYSTDELANTILAVMVSSINLSLALTNIINLYLGSDQDATLKKLAREDDPQAFAGFVYEGLRLDPPFQGFFRISAKDQTLAGQGLKKGDRVFANVGAANQSDKIFPQASSINTTRSTSDCLFGDGALKYLGETLTIKITGEVLRAIYAYNNVRRAPGQSGKLKRFTERSHPQYHFAYLDRNQSISPWPTSLTIQYDA